MLNQSATVLSLLCAIEADQEIGVVIHDRYRFLSRPVASFSDICLKKLSRKVHPSKEGCTFVGAYADCELRWVRLSFVLATDTHNMLSGLNPYGTCLLCL
jgi:hypothetical protein